VFQAYYQLEARGWIEARERSGYFVRAPRRAAGRSETSPRIHLLQGGDSDLVMEVLERTSRRDVVPFASPFPNPRLFPLEQIGRVMAEAARGLSPAQTVDGLVGGKEALRQAIAVRYLQRGVTVSPDEIVITNGALEALNLSLASVAAPGDAVVIESPGFYGAKQALHRLGMRAVEVPVHPVDGIDLQRLDEAIIRSGAVACWLMPSHQNPLGISLGDAKKRELVEMVTRRGVALIEDDVYGEMSFDHQPSRPAKAWDRAGVVLHCSSFSKCLAPGYRVGWVAAGVNASAVSRMKLNTTLMSTMPGQLGLARYLDQGSYARHLRKLQHGLAAQATAYMRAVQEFFPAGTRMQPPTGGYFVWLRLPEEVDAVDLYRRALAQGISIAPGPMFSNAALHRSCVRINFSIDLDARALNALRVVGALATAMQRTAAARQIGSVY